MNAVRANEQVGAVRVAVREANRHAGFILPESRAGFTGTDTIRRKNIEQNLVELGAMDRDGWFAQYRLEIASVGIAQDDPFSDCTRREVIRLVRQAVLALPPHYREVVALCDFQEMSYSASR